VPSYASNNEFHAPLTFIFSSGKCNLIINDIKNVSMNRLLENRSIMATDCLNVQAVDSKVNRGSNYTCLCAKPVTGVSRIFR
jgi:hypothetical protein